MNIDVHAGRRANSEKRCSSISPFIIFSLLTRLAGGNVHFRPNDWVTSQHHRYRFLPLNVAMSIPLGVGRPVANITFQSSPPCLSSPTPTLIAKRFSRLGAPRTHKNPDHCVSRTVLEKFFSTGVIKSS